MPQTGRYSCPQCGQSVDFYLTSPVEELIPALPAPAVLAGAAEEAGPFCATHPDQRGISVCDRCGDFLCAHCSRPTEGRNYCHPCFGILYRRGGFERLQRAFIIPRLALVFSFVPPYSMVGLVLAIIALVQISRQPDLPGRGLAVAALVIACLSTLIGLLFVLSPAFSHLS